MKHWLNVAVIMRNDAGICKIRRRAASKTYFGLHFSPRKQQQTHQRLRALRVGDAARTASPLI